MTTLQQPNDSLKIIKKQECLIIQLQNQNQELQSQNQELQNQLAWLNKQIFGPKSEKIITIKDPSAQMLVPGCEPLPEQEITEPTKTKKTLRRKKYICNGKDKFSFPDNLPVEKIYLDITEKEKICPKTGLPLVQIGEDIVRKLACLPATFFIKEFIKPKYALPNKSEEGIKYPQMPDSILPKSLADESLLADILVKKFIDHLPLNRIREIYYRSDIRISNQLLSNWVIKISKNLSILYDEMLKCILESKNIFVDESPVSLLVEGKNKVHQAYMWVYVGGMGKDPPYRYYDFCLNRRHDNAFRRLENYEGSLHSDKYGAYETLAKQEGILWHPCWSHIRRKFIEAESGDIEFRDWILRKIKYLFLFERIVLAKPEEERLSIRIKKEEPILNEIINEIKYRVEEGRFLPKSKFGKALTYTYNLIPYLKNYLKNPNARLDNNVAERAVRPLAVGRKNWLFAGSEDGGKAIATILSLVQTCKNLKINPADYLEDILRRIMSHPANRIRELLPNAWVERVRKDITNFF